jgi:hypothetical protein
VHADDGEVISAVRARPKAPETYAARRYRNGLRNWHRAVDRRLGLLLGGPFLALLAWGALRHQPLTLSIGFVCGAIAAMVHALRDMAPKYVEAWGEGAEGEARTHRVLAGAGGVLVDDIDRGRGNFDHVFVGPKGVLLVETKNLQGIVEIRDGVARLRRRHDPEADQPLWDLRRTALRDAQAVFHEVQRRCGQRCWVSAVVVFWGEFPQGIVEADRITYVHGSRLLDWLGSRPSPRWPVPVDQVAAAVLEMKREGEERATAARTLPLLSSPVS